jgi:hypothetical protein
MRQVTYRSNWMVSGAEVCIAWMDLPGDDPWNLGKSVKVGHQHWDGGSDDRLVQGKHLVISSHPYERVGEDIPRQRA